jgi:putative sugar O-methyltransferase
MTADARPARTSISDLDDMYLDWVRAALQSDDMFRTFRQLPGIKGTIERVKPSRGAIYRDIALRQMPRLLDHMDKLSAGDNVGSPDTARYPEGALSPTTWRYVKVLSDLTTLFGPLDGWHIAEIGAGYGGQCKVIHDVYDVASYTIYDLEPVSMLARTFLTRVGSRATRGLRIGDFWRLGEGPADTFDLLISNWALSECDKAIQDGYIEHVLRRSRRGYLTCNQISQLCGVDSYAIDDFIDRLGFPVNVRHEDLSDPARPEATQTFVLDWQSQPLLAG